MKEVKSSVAANAEKNSPVIFTNFCIRQNIYTDTYASVHDCFSYGCQVQFTKWTWTERYTHVNLW